VISNISLKIVIFLSTPFEKEIHACNQKQNVPTSGLRRYTSYGLRGTGPCCSENNQLSMTGGSQRIEQQFCEEPRYHTIKAHAG
jgi:hypothetical protein